jgi:penicillin-binding protein 1A
MQAAHQGVEIREIPGIGLGQKLPQPANPAAMAAAGAPKGPEIKPGPPPVLTRRGADVLVQVEKLLDEAAKTAVKASDDQPKLPAKPTSSSGLAFPDSFAAATPDRAAPSAPRKN